MLLEFPINRQTQAFPAHISLSLSVSVSDFSHLFHSDSSYISTMTPAITTVVSRENAEHRTISEKSHLSPNTKLYPTKRQPMITVEENDESTESHSTAVRQQLLLLDPPCSNNCQKLLIPPKQQQCAAADEAPDEKKESSADNSDDAVSPKAAMVGPLLMKPSPSVANMDQMSDPIVSPRSVLAPQGGHGGASCSDFPTATMSMMEEAWERLKKSFVFFKGRPVGSVAAVDPSAEALNYNQVKSILRSSSLHVE